MRFELSDNNPRQIPSSKGACSFMVCVLCVAATLCWPGTNVQAQTQTHQQSEIGEQVAALLYDQGLGLFEQGDIANAKKLFGESLERSPKGSRSADALRMLRACNEKLGFENLDAGLPKLPTSQDGPLDPYGDSSGAEAGPLDPYGNGSQGPMDPTDTESVTATSDTASSFAGSGQLFLAHGGLQGMLLGMALGGPYEEFEDGLGSMQGGAIALGFIGAGGLGYLSHWLSEKKRLSEHQGNVISSAGLWGSYTGAHLANVLVGENSDGNDIYTGMTLGGLAGSTLGYWYAQAEKLSPGELAFTNSLTLYGSAGGLLLGVAMDPPRGDAYSLNALLGAGLGLGLAYYLDVEEPSRSRMWKVDAGAAAGALAPWVLLYPFIGDGDSSGDEQLTGLFSLLGLGGGGYLAWILTENAETGPSDDEVGLVPAVLQRSGTQQWSFATPSLQPMHMPALAPKEGISFGTNLVSGRF